MLCDNVAVASYFFFSQMISMLMLVTMATSY